jgi:poly(beta-D-mannuronate) lyase
MRCLFLSLSLSASLLAKDIPVSDAKAFNTAAKSAQPGDTLVLTSGTWQDAQLKIKAEGSKWKPITVKAAEPGKTILTGESRLQLSGHSIVVEGLWFQDPGQLSGEVIELRTNSKELAFDCIIRGCAVTSSKPVNLGKKTARFVSLYGTGNVIESCHFEGKTTGGTLMVVWLTPGGEGRHEIRGNYFGPRPALGENGGETIRLGDSETHDQNARCKVSENYFYRCNGEGEIVSVKSCENQLLGNTFVECEGALTLRHAHRCLVSSNVFQGNHKKLTGGVRIVGEDHQVLANYFENLDGDGYRAAITFMNGIPNTNDSGYQQVKRAQIKNNSVIDCKQSMLIGMAHDKKCTLPPIDCTVENNIFHSPKRQLIKVDTAPINWTWRGNAMTGSSIGIDNLPGIVDAKQVDPMQVRALPRSEAGVPWLR